MTAVGDAHYVAREPINPGPDAVPEKKAPHIPSTVPICRNSPSRIGTCLSRIRQQIQMFRHPPAPQCRWANQAPRFVIASQAPEISPLARLQAAAVSLANVVTAASDEMGEDYLPLPRDWNRRGR